MNLLRRCLRQKIFSLDEIKSFSIPIQTYSAEELGSLCGAGTNLVVLDRLQDPGNIGTILRTAEGAGYAAAVLIY